MEPEYIKRRREETVSELRKLFIKINGKLQEQPQGSQSGSEAFIQTLEDDNRIYNICDCCQTSDIPNDQMTRIESGQQLCPTCLKVFNTASESASNLNC